MDPSGPWLGPESPLYHLQQLVGLHRAGLDALAVVLPADRQERATLYQHLSALVSAVTAYDQANAARLETSTPLLLPFIELSSTHLDLRSTAGQAELAGWLDDFYRLVPPQYRVMLSGPAGPLCYPVILGAPGGVSWDDTFTARITARVQARWGTPVGWLLDSGWKTEKPLSDVLCYCPWKMNNAIQQGEGPLSTMAIAPARCSRTRSTSPAAVARCMRMAG